MHSSGSITSIRANSWMQSTGHTSMHDLSFRSMHGSAMMYVKRPPETPGRTPKLYPTRSAIRSPNRPASTDLGTTFANPAARAERSSAASVCLPKPSTGTGSGGGDNGRRVAAVDVGDDHVRRLARGRQPVAGRGQHRLDLRAEEEVDVGERDDGH